MSFYTWGGADATSGLANALAGKASEMFRPTDPVLSQQVNAILRQSSLIDTALMAALGVSSATLSADSTKNNLRDSISSSDKLLPDIGTGIGDYILTATDHDRSREWKDPADIVVGYATEALYASADRSKGTIEQRLTALGFRESTITPSQGMVATTAPVKRQGNYVIGRYYGSGTVDSDGGSGVGTLIGTIPENFRPATTVLLFAGVDVFDSMRSTERESYAGVTINTDGTITLHPGMSQTAQRWDIYFGFEASPIS